MSYPQLILGGAMIGETFTDVAQTKEFLEVASSDGITRIDTAARYPATKPGTSQKFLGETGIAAEKFALDTKIAVLGAQAAGSLSSFAIENSISDSLDSLKTSSVNVLYCHMPDTETPLEEQAAAFHKHFQDGKFAELGVSNFTAEMIEDWMRISEEEGYVKPTVYQGQYNLFCRKSETTLFPVLKKHGMRFVAFSPLAGGFLTGKFHASASSTDLQDTRFAAGNPMGGAFRGWYDKAPMLEGLGKLRDISQTSSIPMAELANRWCVYHSALKGGDGVILGASRVSQLEQNLRQIKAGPLQEDIVSQLESLWEVVKEAADDIV